MCEPKVNQTPFAKKVFWFACVAFDIDQFPFAADSSLTQLQLTLFQISCKMVPWSCVKYLITELVVKTVITYLDQLHCWHTFGSQRSRPHPEQRILHFASRRIPFSHRIRAALVLGALATVSNADREPVPISVGQCDFGWTIALDSMWLVTVAGLHVWPSLLLTFFYWLCKTLWINVTTTNFCSLISIVFIHTLQREHYN